MELNSPTAHECPNRAGSEQGSPDSEHGTGSTTGDESDHENPSKDWIELKTPEREWTEHENPKTDSTDQTMMYTCRWCNYTSLQGYVRSHMRKWHSEAVGYNEVSMRDRSGIDLSYKCPTCEKTFPLWSCWKKHIRTPPCQKPYKCRKCEKSYTDKRPLKKHYDAHHTEHNSDD